MDHKFRYTQPSCFNDPFELFPVFTGNFTNDQLEELLDPVTQPQIIEKVLESILRSGYENLNSFQKAQCSYEFYSKNKRKLLEREISSKNLSIKESIKNKFEDIDYSHEYLKLINNTIGILCLSKKSDDILMWSHYCNSHTGVVIKINTENSFFEYLDEVKYPESNLRPTLEITKSDYSKVESMDLYKQIFYSKSEAWSYEKEYRDYKQLINGENINQFDKLGFPKILFEFPSDIIEGVIFGARVMDEKIIYVMDKVEKDYTNISFGKVYLDQDKFQFNIHEIH